MAESTTPPGTRTAPQSSFVQPVRFDEKQKGEFESPLGHIGTGVAPPAPEKIEDDKQPRTTGDGVRQPVFRPDGGKKRRGKKSRKSRKGKKPRKGKKSRKNKRRTKRR